MKQVLFKTMLLLCSLMVGANAWAADRVKWIKTEPKDLKADDIVVIVDMTAAVAMSNDPAADKSPSAKTVTLNDNKDQLDTSDGDIAANLQWTLAISGGKYQFKKDADNVLFVKSDDAGLRVGAGTGDGEVSLFGLIADEANNKADFLYAVMSESENRYVGVYSMFSMFNSWKTKTSIDEDINGTVIAFFKKTVSSKQDVSIKFEKDNYEADFSAGAASFTAPTPTITPGGLAVKYSSSNTWAAIVDENTGAVTLKKRGTAVITAEYAEDDKYEGAKASYTLRVDESSGDGGSANPFTVAQAIDYINNGMSASGSNYFIKGIVSKINTGTKTYSVPGYGDTNDGALTYFISDDGKETNQMQVTSGKGLANASLEAERNICIGDEVIVVGPVSNSSSTPGVGGSGSTKTPKVDKGNYMYQQKPRILAPDCVLYKGKHKLMDNLCKVNGECETSVYYGDQTCSFSNTTVAELVEGEVSARAEGIDTVTVTVPFYNSESTKTDETKVFTTVKKFIITVKSRDVAPAGTDAGYYELVTSATTPTLAENDRLLIVGTASDKSYVMTSTDGLMGGKSASEVTFESDGTIKTVPDGALTVTLKSVAGGKFALATDIDKNKYLYNSVRTSGFDISMLMGGDPKNALREGEIKATIGDSAHVAIAVSAEGIATITMRSDSLLRFNDVMDLSELLGEGTTFESPSFDAYVKATGEDTQKGYDVKLYRFKKVEDTYDLAIGATGWRTLVSSIDVAPLPDGMEAYIVTKIEDGKSTMEAVTEIAVNHPYLLKGAAKTYTMNKATSVLTAPTTNKLKISGSGTSGSGSTSKVYVLANGSDGVGFYKWTGGLLGSGRVYLDATDFTTTSSSSYIEFDFDSTTGITELKDSRIEELKSDDAWYDLQGRRVAQPTKGVYIVNGQKVVIK